MRLMSRSRAVRDWLPALTAAIPVVIIYLAVLGIVLTAAGPEGLNLGAGETSGWIALLYGWPTVLALVLTIRYRQPLLLTGNVFAIIFFVSLGDRIGFSALAGASMVAGAILLLTALLGLTGRIAAWIPAPIVQGLIAGAVMPFVVNVFSSLSTTRQGVGVPTAVPLMVGAALLAYLVTQRFFGTRVPPILPAFLAGVLVAALTGQLGAFPSSFSLPALDVIRPEFSWAAIATATPVLVALMTVPSNIPSVIFMRSQGYEPPERLINVVSGGGTIVGSFFGPVAVSLALPPLLLTAGPAAGDRSIRYRSAYLPIAAGLAIAAFASTAADLAVLVPSVLLLSMGGLALLGALAAALKEISQGPLTLGPLFAFAIALSDMTLFGLGPFFWSLVLGTLVSMALEPNGWRTLRQHGAADHRPDTKER
jgi:benzoate membrane transport protein